MHAQESLCLGACGPHDSKAKPAFCGPENVVGSARLEASRTRADPGAEGTLGAHKHAWVGGVRMGMAPQRPGRAQAAPHTAENGPHSEALLVQLECCQGIQLPFGLGRSSSEEGRGGETVQA